MTRLLERTSTETHTYYTITLAVYVPAYLRRRYGERGKYIPSGSFGAHNASKERGTKSTRKSSFCNATTHSSALTSLSLVTRSFVTYILSVRSTRRAARPGLTSSGDSPGTATALLVFLSCESSDDEHDPDSLIETEDPPSPDHGRREIPPEDVEAHVVLWPGVLSSPLMLRLLLPSLPCPVSATLWLTSAANSSNNRGYH